MALVSGSRVGPYEVIDLIGSGGMGEVYRATDTNLARQVAIKVLPEALASDAERLARFDREAKLLAALNHPNIASVYGVEAVEGGRALVMELVDGATLAERLAHGPLPLGEAVAIARQIADALDAAHEQGIVHRDLKPANIKVRPDGAVKVLDFGLAKWVAPADAAAIAPAEGTISGLPTLTSPAMTQAGVVLGTAAYMSPEQARGQLADKRSDVWAFGCVLFEMLTGRRAFAGALVPDTLAAVLRDQPDWSALPSHVPPTIRTLLRRCLEKDRKRRLRDIGDARLELDVDVVAPPAEPSTRAWRTALAIALPLIALVISAALWVVRQAPPVQTTAFRSSLLPPSDASFSPHDFAISPDGKRVAFVSIAPDGSKSLWLRSLDTRGSQMLNDTTGASYPFWAPDSRRLGFFVAGQLRTVDTATGATQTLAEAPVGRGGAWSDEGVIVFAPNVAGPLLSVSERGGRTQPVTDVDSGSGKAHRWPWMLPDQRRFLFFEQWGGASDPRPPGLYVGSIDGGETKLISPAISGSVAFAGGHLLYVQGASLMAHPFDPGTLTLTGAAMSIVDQEVPVDWSFGHANFSVSSTGVILFQSSADAMSELIWYGGDGVPQRRLNVTNATTVDLSPDGRFLAYGSNESGDRRYVRTFDFQRGVSTRLTDGGRDDWPVWSNDGTRIAYTTHQSAETFTLHEIGLDGGSARQLARAARMLPTHYSPDGRSLLVMTFERGAPNVAIFDTRDGTWRIWARGAEAQYSPDGKWIAWVIVGEVYAQATDQRSPRLQISSAGGAQPRWSRDGRRLFYLTPDRKLMEVPLEFGRDGTLNAGVPRARFQTHVVTPWFGFFQYVVTPDGSRFLVNSLKPGAPLTLLTGWPALLQR